MATQLTLNDGSLNSAGALAIKTNGTTQAINITTGQQVEFNDGSASAPSITNTGDGNTGIFFPAADTIAFAEGGVEAMRLDSAGNMGLGVTPSAWGSGYKALQINNGGLVTNTGGTFTAVVANAYFDGTNYKYTSTAAASLYRQNAGVHDWQIAGSGTAGNSITFTQAMTLDASGNLGVGQTSMSSDTRLHLTKTTDNCIAKIQSSYGAILQLINGGGSEVSTINATGNNVLTFQTGSTERARIDSSGRLLVGATSAADSTLRTQSGSSSADGRIQAWFSTSNNGSYGNLQLGSANTGTNTECSIKFVSGATALGNSPASANGTQYDWGIGLSTYTVGGNVFGVACTANGGNNVKLNYNSTSWLTGSDERIKDITGNIENALSIISAWRTVFYTLKTDASKDVKAGLIAQDVIQTLPEVVDVPEREYNDKGELIPLSVAYTEIVPVLVKAIQEQQAIIETLTARITALEQA